MRSATAVVTAALLASLSIPAAAQPAPAAAAKTLGEAYRAYEGGEYAAAYERAASIDLDRLINADYALFVLGQSAFLTGDYAAAVEHFRALARRGGSRFAAVAPWRVADSLWQLGRVDEASAAYQRLLKGEGGDVAVARFRIAEADARAGRTARAISRLQEFRREHPAHALEPRAEERLVELGGARAAQLGATDRLARARALTADRLWHESIAELAIIDDDESAGVRLRRDHQTAMTLFRMRRQYKRAGDILLSIYERLDGDDQAHALFHGARALSRADYDKEAIEWYQRVVAEYPSSRWAPEAQFLSGWLEYNMGNYEEALPYLRVVPRRFSRSRWVGPANWFEGFSLYLLGRYQEAIPMFERLARESDRLEGGRGRYWLARSLQGLERADDANEQFRALVGRYPFSWYALLARSRLAEQGLEIGPFGDSPRDPAASTAVDEKVDERLASDPLIRAADELRAAGLGVEAGLEMRRGERAFLRRHDRSAALAMLLDRYRRGGDYNRPWMIAIVYGGWRALDAPPEGRARVWWEHAHPQAYRELVETYRHLGDNPPYYLYAIMHKESGFNPHVVSYADALGLLQMIPPTTRRVVRELGLEYTDDLLFTPELNIQTASWYIGKLLQKFKGQIPFGSGSYNSGPRPVMRWMDNNGHRPVDEFVELVSYSQTREYMKKVTETYARYLYLYEGTIYEQPLVVDRDYVRDELTY